MRCSHAENNNKNGKKIPSIQVLFASSLDLSSHAAQAYWCASGSQNREFITLFHDLLSEARKNSDQIALFMQQAGESIGGTLRAAFQCSALPDYPLDSIPCSAHVEALYRSMSEFTKQVHRTIDQIDPLAGTELSDSLAELSRRTDLMLISLESHLVEVHR